MKIEDSIRSKLEAQFSPSFLEIENESFKHSRGGQETHFRIIVVSAQFAGLSRVERQRQVAHLFEEERRLGLHALSQRTFTPEEWEQWKDRLDLKSPPCQSHDQD
jgi:BolA protein